MTTLADGANITLTLSDYDSVTVSTRGVVTVDAVSGLGVTAGKIEELTGTRTFGPYAVAGSLKLTSLGGSVEYEVADGATPGTPALFYRDSSGNVTGLVGAKIPYVPYKSAVPVGIPSSGSIGNNGALTGITALNATYSNGIYLFFPANAIFAGSAAGLYWTVMSGTTAGTIYNNLYTPGDPVAPVSPTPFVTTGPGAFTQVTTEVTLRTLPILGGALGLNGWLNAEAIGAMANTAGSKTIRIKFAGTSIYSNAYTSVAGNYCLACVAASNSQSLQVITAGGSSGGNGSTGVSITAFNTAVDQNITVTGQLAVATDWVISSATKIMVSPS